jgi:hypothetical protein
VVTDAGGFARELTATVSVEIISEEQFRRVPLFGAPYPVPGD